jgi:hypothetical protein
MRRACFVPLLAVLAATAVPAAAQTTGWSYCAVVNETARKVFVSAPFERAQGREAADAQAFVADKGLDRAGMYDPAPPKITARCNWEADRDGVQRRIRNTEEQAQKNGFGFMGLGWVPAK